MGTSDPILLFLDEDVDPLLAGTLRLRGIDAVSVHHLGLRGAPDHELLERATAEGRVLMTHNITDFVGLATRWAQAGRVHAGIVVSRQVSFKILLRRATKFLARNDAGGMRDRLDWLENYR